MSDELMALEKAELIERSKQAEAKAQECQIEAAVYRRELMNCEAIALRAERTNNPQLLLGVESEVSLSLKEQNIRQWGKEWRDTWEHDIKWLRRALLALKEIEVAASKLSEADQSNANLRMKIRGLAERALAQDVLSSVSVSQTIAPPPNKSFNPSPR